MLFCVWEHGAAGLVTRRGMPLRKKERMQDGHATVLELAAALQ